VKPGRGCNICFKRVTRRAIISNAGAATGAVMARGLHFRGNGWSCKFNKAPLARKRDSSLPLRFVMKRKKIYVMEKTHKRV